MDPNFGSFFRKSDRRPKVSFSCPLVEDQKSEKFGFDPLFYLNHTYVMLRAHINRFIRKNWCATKDTKRLKDHIDLYVDFHHHQIISR
jgi:hypothetical protein